MGWRHDIEYVLAVLVWKGNTQDGLRFVLDRVPLDDTCVVTAKAQLSGGADHLPRQCGSLVKVRFSVLYEADYKSATYDAALKLYKDRKLAAAEMEYYVALASRNGDCEYGNIYGIEHWNAVRLA